MNTRAREYVTHQVVATVGNASSSHQNVVLPEQSQVVIKAEDMPVGGDSNHNLLALCQDQLIRW